MATQLSTSKIKEYWEKSTPMNFGNEQWNYTQKRQFRYQLQDYMHEVIDFDKWKSKTVLEIGCGSGIDACEFARHGAIVTATDITQNACRFTWGLAKEAGLQISVICLPTQSALPFYEESFDLVYSFGVLHHIPEVENTLEQISKVLKPNGNIIAMVYNENSLLNAYSILYSKAVKGKKTKVVTFAPQLLASQYSERNEGCPYTKLYTEESAKELFGKWFDVEISVHYNKIDMPGQRKVPFTIDEKYKLGWHIMVKGTKKQ